MKDVTIVESEERQAPRRPRSGEPNGANGMNSIDQQALEPGVGSGLRARRTVSPALAALALLIAVVVAGAAVASWRSSTRTITTVRTVTAVVPVTVDAIGCPLTTNCDVSATPPPAVVSALTRWSSGAILDSGTVTYDEKGTPVHSVVIAEVGGANRVLLTVVSQCVPRGALVPAAVRGDPGTGVNAVTMSGRPGCSVVVTGALPVARLALLAHAPELQLRTV